MAAWMAWIRADVSAALTIEGVCPEASPRANFVCISNLSASINTEQGIIQHNLIGHREVTVHLQFLPDAQKRIISNLRLESYPVLNFTFNISGWKVIDHPGGAVIASGGGSIVKFTLPHGGEARIRVEGSGSVTVDQGFDAEGNHHTPTIPFRGTIGTFRIPIESWCHYWNVVTDPEASEEDEEGHAVTVVMPKGTTDDVSKGRATVMLKARHGVAAPVDAHAAVWVKPVEGSGGHEEEFHVSPRPRGTMNQATGMPFLITAMPAGATQFGPLVYESGEFGGDEEIYVAISDDPFAITSTGLTLNAAVAAIEEIEAHVADGRAQSIACALPHDVEVNIASRIRVKVPGLIRLPDNTAGHYIKVGGTAQHHGPENFPDEDNNHYGTSRLWVIVLSIAAWYQGTDTEGTKLRINDMALPFGGTFDICGTWNPNDRCGNPAVRGHFEHSKGTAVDIPFSVHKPNTPPFNRVARRDEIMQTLDYVRDVVKGSIFEFDYDPEGNHFHLIMTGG